MTIGKPGIITILDDAGAFTAGHIHVSINGTEYTQNFSSDKNTTMTALAAQLAANAETDTAVYSSGAHTIVITPLIGKQLYITSDVSGVTGGMTVTISTTPAYPTWATDPAAELVEPSDPLKATGWIHGNKPPASWFNWLFNLLFLWVKWVEDQIENVIPSKVDLIVESGSFTCTFPTNKEATFNYIKYSGGYVRLWWNGRDGMDSEQTHTNSATTIPISIQPTGEAKYFPVTTDGDPAIMTIATGNSGLLIKSLAATTVLNGGTGFYNLT
jgi:hypothetical protein